MTKRKIDARDESRGKEQWRNLKRVSRTRHPGLPTSEDNEYKEKQALIKHLIKESFR